MYLSSVGLDSAIDAARSGSLREVPRRRDGRPRRFAYMLGLPEELVGRIRGLFLLCALMNATVLPLVLVSVPVHRTSERVAVGAALGLLAWWWVRGFRRGRFPLLGEFVECGALYVLATAFDEPVFVLGLLYVGLMYRSLYGSLPVNLLRTMLYLVAYTGVLAPWRVPDPGTVGEAVTQMPGFAMVALLMHVLASALHDHARATTREQILADAGAAFTAVKDRAGLHAAALRSARSLADGEVVLMTVSGGGALAAVAGADGRRAPAPLAITDLPASLRAATSPVAVPAALSATWRRTFGLGPEPSPGLFVPLVLGGELRGAAVCWGSNVENVETAETFDHLASALVMGLERLELADGLRRSERRFRSLVQNASDVVTVVDADSTIMYATPSVQRLLGHPVSAVTGQRMTDLVHPDDLADAIAFFVRAPETSGVTPTMQWRVRHLDGTYRDVELVCANLVDDDSVGGLVLTARDVTERTVLQEQLTQQAFHDPLTGLANRMLFTDRVEHAVARASRAGQQVAVLFADLDDFKGVNDRMGHAAGDELLMVVSDRLRGCVRPGDTVARLGGDEFAILLEDLTGDDHGAVVAERVLESLSRSIDLSGGQVVVGASVGVAFGGDDQPVDELMKMADVAMYLAKERGKHRYEIFEPSMHRAVLHRRQLKSDLQRAVESAELMVHYQPIVELGSEAVLGFEALVRWWHPQWGLVQPGEFIEAAEENGLIVPLGSFVLTEAIRQVADWQRRFPRERPLRVSVNVASRQLQDDGLVDAVVTALAEHGLPPSSLVLEITEGAMMRDTPAVLERLWALKSLGLQLAVDDFGTGYSSLSYLRRFPLDILKIDRSFVEVVDQGPEDSALARAIVRLAEALRLTTVAEGIETPAQAEIVREMGCRLGQGFLYAAPLDALSVEKLLSGEREQTGGALAAVEPPEVP